MNKNVIAFRNGFILPPANGTVNENPIRSMQFVAELMQFGYVFDENAVIALSEMSTEELSQLYTDIVTYLNKMMGGGKQYRPFWKGFPDEVIEKSEAELWLHQLINYWTNGAYEPSDFTKERPTAFEQASYTTITVPNEKAFMKIFTDLVSVNQSLTPDDLETIKWFAENYEPHQLVFPDQIPFKENLCTLAGLYLPVPVKTVTDVLRIAVSMSGGDISLPKVPPAVVKMQAWYRGTTMKNAAREAFKFKKFSRKERKFLLGLLESTNLDVGEMKLKRERWLRLAYYLHPGEHRYTYPKAYKALNNLRNERVQSWYGKLTYAFNKSIQHGLEVLTERPGEFMRKLDWLLRSNTTLVPEILKTLFRVAPKVSNKVLYEAYAHFESRNKPVTGRTIMIKGARKRTALPDLPALQQEIVDDVQDIIKQTLVDKFAGQDPLGRVWIDDELKKLPVPTNMRSLNPTLKPVARGSRLPMGVADAKVIRPFLHFTKESTAITIDLSAVLIGERGKPAICAWNHHKIGKDVVIHSGDSFARTGACAEYIDIDIEKALEAGYQYALIQLHNWTGDEELYDNNHFGIMERTEPKANKLWLPATIENCSLIHCENITNCAILDLTTREYIIVDEDAGGKGWVNMANSLSFKDVEAYIKPPKFSVYDLLMLHVIARGEQVERPEDADIKFEFKQFADSYVEILKMMGV